MSISYRKSFKIWQYYLRQIIKILVVVLAISICCFNEVEGKGVGVGAGMRSGSGFGRRGIGLNSGRTALGGGGGGWNAGLRSRWWILGAAGGLGYGGYRGGRYLGSSETNTSSIDEVTTAEGGIAACGFLYAILWFVFLIYKFSFKPGKYNQSEFTVMYFLAFACLSAFAVIAYNVRAGPATDEIEELESDAWINWFEANSTNFIQYGGSPLNYFDLFYAAAGLGIATLLVIKDIYLPEGHSPINMLTLFSLVGFVIVAIVSVGIGLTGSWKVPMILFSGTGICIAFLRYVGLLYAHQKGRRNDCWTSSKRKKFKRFEMLELLSGIFCIIFHTVMSSTYDDWAIFFINSGVIGFAVLALIFDPFFLLMLYLKPRRKAPIEVYGDPSYAISEPDTAIYNKEKEMCDD